MPVRAGQSRRFGRRGRRDTTPDTGDESVDVLGTEAHDWWANRSHLEHGVPGTRTSGDPDTPDDEHDWDTDWLFAGGTADDAATEETSPTDQVVPLMDLQDACEVLGVPVGADWDEIVAAHRGLAKRHHPDRLPHASDDEREAASNKMAAINVALDILRRRVGPHARETVADMLST